MALITIAITLVAFQHNQMIIDNCFMALLANTLLHLKRRLSSLLCFGLLLCTPWVHRRFFILLCCTLFHNRSKPHRSLGNLPLVSWLLFFLFSGTIIIIATNCNLSIQINKIFIWTFIHVLALNFFLYWWNEALHSLPQSTASITRVCECRSQCGWIKLPNFRSLFSSFCHSGFVEKSLNARGFYTFAGNVSYFLHNLLFFYENC